MRSPNVVRLDQRGPRGTYVLFFDGRSNWSLANPDRPVPGEMRYEEWKQVSGVRFPTRRVNFLSGVKRGEVTTGDIRVNVGLRPQDLAAKPADFSPEIPSR